MVEQYSFTQSSGCVSSTYMDRHLDINEKMRSIVIDWLMELELLFFFIIEQCLVEYKMLKFPPSLLAAAAIYTALCSLYWFKQWSKTSEWHTSYTEDQLLECSRMMVGFHQNAGAGKLTGVHRKYSTLKFGYAAKAETALFLLGL
ncbi:hypothetical protein NC651_011731 [Populus alba x Populus x berolinensis]|nr:hypothetical protein NC651_011731 [Populus alba x Populus x berolinensis]